MKRIWYIDSTLRDGEQAPGVSFSNEEKMNIAILLNELGIDEVEVGTPIIGKKEIEIIRLISEAGFSFKTTSWCRATQNDIDAAKEATTNGINLSFPVSDCQLKIMNKSQVWVMEKMLELIPVAKDNFEYTAVGLQDASRTDYKFLKEIVSFAVDLGVDRIRIADTVGILNPLNTASLFNMLSTDFPETDFEFHGHNDLGMATANTVMAAISGARSVSTTINGLGERAGNASLDEVVTALKYSSSIEPDINTQWFQKAAEYVAACSRRPIHDSKPVTGKKVYTHESGIHTNLLIADRSTYQIIDNKTIGQLSEPEIVFGKHSGSNALHNFYKNQGIELTFDQLQSILSQVRMRAGLKKENICNKEIMEMYYQLT